MLGYDTSTATNGDEAIANVKKAKETGNFFLAAILDLTIPGGRGGKEVIGELIEEDPAVKVIASSGYSQDPVMSDPSEYGFAGCLIKPYRKHDLVAMLESIFKVTH